MQQYLNFYHFCQLLAFQVAWPSHFQVFCYSPPPEGSARQSPTFPTIKPIKIYTFRIFSIRTCQLTYYARVSCLWTKVIDLTHQGQFLTPNSQIRTNCSLILMTLCPFLFSSQSTANSWEFFLSKSVQRSVRVSHDCSRLLEYAKVRTILQSISKLKHAKIFIF